VGIYRWLENQEKYTITNRIVQEADKMDGLELLKVDEEAQTVLARDLHRQLAVTERFATWFERQLQYGFTEGEDFTGVKVFTAVNNGAKLELLDYNITLDMAKQICMLQRTTEGRRCRQYLIDLEKAWNTPEMVYARALKMADRQIESLKERNTHLIGEVERMKPKEVFADAVTASKSSILIGQLAKILRQNGYDTGEKRLYEYMRNNGYLISRKGREYNAPTQRSIERGLFEIREKTIDVNNSTHITRTTMVTGKGQVYFINRLLKGQQSERLDTPQRLTVD
jgi:anti-repressor protein